MTSTDIDQGTGDTIIGTLLRVDARLQALEKFLMDKPTPKIITRAQALELTGLPSVDAQSRWFQKHGIHPYVRGRYLRLDVTNKVAHLNLFPAPRAVRKP